MDLVTWFDIIIIALVLMLGIKGILNGLIKEAFGLIGLIGGLIRIYLSLASFLASLLPSW